MLTPRTADPDTLARDARVNVRLKKEEKKENCKSTPSTAVSAGTPQVGCGSVWILSVNVSFVQRHMGVLMAVLQMAHSNR